MADHFKRAAVAGAAMIPPDSSPVIASPPKSTSCELSRTRLDRWKKGGTN
jgi:hypothetical protein